MEGTIFPIIQRILEDNTDDELKSELLKCKVICSNCHRQITAKLIRIKEDQI